MEQEFSQVNNSSRIYLLRSVVGTMVIVAILFLVISDLAVTHGWAKYLIEWNRWKNVGGDGQQMPIEVWGSRFMVRAAEGGQIFPLLLLPFSFFACLLVSSKRWLFRIFIFANVIVLLLWACLMVNIWYESSFPPDPTKYESLKLKT